MAEQPAGDSGLRFAAPRVVVANRSDGTQLVGSPDPLGSYSRCVGEWLLHWAGKAPDRIFLAERGAAGWRRVTYGEALTQVIAAATWMLKHRLGETRPLVLLSDNSVQHALLSLAAMHVGVPAVPLSPAYSLMSRDHAKLKAIVTSIEPGAIYAAPASRYAPALAAIRQHHRAVLILDDPAADAAVAGGGLVGGGVAGARNDLASVAGGSIPATGEGVGYASLLEDTDPDRVDQAFRAIGPDTLAKVLFTSGSTGAPKGVINNQRMLCASQQAKLQVWPFLASTPPVIVDWLPWNHTFGGNHNFNMILRNGGTLYIDAGKAAPGLFEQTLENLRDISPTIYFNVPRGYDFLVNALERDQVLRERFFRRLQLIFYAAAALPQHLWEALQRLSREALGAPLPMVAAWGSTETAPLATDCHFQAQRSGVIGLPVPGCELKLVPAGDKLEIRVRGDNVTPGYWRAPVVTREAFDDEGFYRIGDAVKWLDPGRPESGLVFDGRIAEDFKLTSGTWVNTGLLRIRAVAALAPIAQDVVVCGHDRDDIRLLVFANAAACRQVAGLDAEASLAAALASPALNDAVIAGLGRLNDEATGSSQRVAAALLLIDAPSIDAGEITDKGYINQGAVLQRRADRVDALYRPAAANPVIMAPKPEVA